MPGWAEKGFVLKYGLVPREFLLSLHHHPELVPYNVLTIFTSMFLHGGFFHLGGNMLYLWIFGNNIEDSTGHLRFLFFYGLSGVAAALLQLMYDPLSGIPMIGASGAISGVLGAYLLLFPYARVKTLIFIFIFITTVDLPAIVLLTIWFLIQILFSHTEGVAWSAHIGGFLFGLASIKLFTIGRPRIRAPRR
ncbi:MAG TPA: rhomboid family intramembrane serine protease [Syntrophorhabdales bacterium]|nr:rhomboid family intramembrane serine protease [Syntrophorhabdales bacterium]